jgi:hypothetical protein
MSIKRRLAAMASIGFVIAAVTAFTIAPAAPAAPSSTGGLTTSAINDVTVTCTAAGAPSSLCAAAGQTLQLSGITGTVTHFSVVNGVLTATGTYTGTLTNTVTGATQALTGTFSGAVSGTGSCQILDLTIGPINLDLLGLVVQTNTIHLNITAQQGPGNLLGNLLCAVANLLNGNGSLTGIANLLNQLLAGL